METFFDAEDYKTYIKLMREWCVSYDLKVWSYCLMMFECMSGQGDHSVGEDFVMEMSSIAGRELGRKKPGPKRNEDS